MSNRTMRRRSLAVLAVGAVGALALSGCAGGGSSGTSDGVTTITFWNGFTGPDGDALKARVDAYNASQDKVKVEMTVMPWDVLGEKLLPALGAHKGPNMAIGGIEGVTQNARTGAYADVSDFYDGWDDASAVFAGAIDAGVVDGKHYSVPMTWSPTLAYYNKTLMSAAGLDPSKPPVTWDEFAADAKAMTKDVDGDGTPDQYGFVMPDHIAPSVWEAIMWSNGGGTVSADGRTATIGDPKSIEAVTYWADLVKNDKISPAGITGPDADALFTAGKVGMLVEGPWMINGFTEAGLDFGVTGTPKGPLGSFSVVNSNQFFISQDTVKDKAQKSAVYDFLKFWNSKDNQIAWSVASGNPPTRSDVTADEVSKNPDMAAFLPFQADSRPFLPHQESFGDSNAIYENAMQKVTAGKGTPKDVLTAANDELQKLIDK